MLCGLWRRRWRQRSRSVHTQPLSSDPWGLSRSEDPHYLNFVGPDRFGECALSPSQPSAIQWNFDAGTDLISRSASDEY
jgi:hypothetical protein